MTEQTPEPVEQDEQQETSPNREAARYRRQLREAEADRDRIAGVVATYRRREAEAMLEKAGMSRGADVFDVGASLDELVAEDGTVSAEKVEALAAATLEQRPHWRRNSRPVGDVGQGPRTAIGGGVNWSDVLKLPGR